MAIMCLARLSRCNPCCAVLCCAAAHRLPASSPAAHLPPWVFRAPASPAQVALPKKLGEEEEFNLMGMLQGLRTGSRR